jgi:hypothetical protein
VESRRYCRLTINQSGKRKDLVILRGRDGKSLPAALRSEGAVLSSIASSIPGKMRPESIADLSGIFGCRAVGFALSSVVGPIWQKATHNLFFPDSAASAFLPTASW